MKPRRDLGQFIVKTCPWKNHQFETNNVRKIYCCPSHQQLDKKDRRRQREYAARELPVSSKPGASYNLNFREVLEVPVKLERSHKTEVEFYKKVPIRASSGLENLWNLPMIDDGTCVHGLKGDCWQCAYVT